jgi:la-related protein 1
MSPTKSPVSFNAPPVMWVKGQQPQPLPESDNGELYTTLRTRALKRRENSKSSETHPDMKVLYEFWSHFLVRNFNLSMYYDFRQCANEDAKRQDFTGLHQLITYYDEILNRKKVINETLASHYVELVKSEDQSGDRPGFQKLRAAWRNGALDLKSRKKIDSFVDSQLREELENGPKLRTTS